MTELTIEERQKQLAQQQAELQAQADELRRQMQEAEREAQIARDQQERLERIRKEKETRETPLKKVSEIIRTVLPALNFELQDWYFRVKDESGKNILFTVYVEVKQRRGWSQANIFDINIGGYGDKQRFPPKKDGSHSYDKIAMCLIGRYNDHLRKLEFEKVAAQEKEKREKAQEHNAPLAQQLNEQFGLKQYGKYQVHPGHVEGKVIVELPSKLMMSPERASQLLALLNEFGFLKSN